MGNIKVIAKNTGLLYIRMLVLMLVSLYTSRIVLDALGVENFGIYNVVGGIVGLMAFLNNSIGTAIQRFLNFELGNNDLLALKKIFVSAFFICVLECLFLVVIAETIGLYFISNYLSIPEDRYEAAFWVYQISICTMVLGIMSVPYNSVIIAHERMGAFAYISIIEGLGKLLFAYLVYVSVYDKLITYAILLALMSIFIQIIYILYCFRFEECKLNHKYDITLVKKLLSFSSWMLFGTTTKLLSTQGVNILINVYFNPVMNAARAIAIQVQTAIARFSDDFMIAVKPRLVKSYAEQNMEFVNNLIFISSKISFFLIFTLSIPVLFETDYILNLWLKIVPLNTAIFLRLILLDFYITVSYSPLGFLSQATGKVRNYQIIIALSFIMIFFGSWLMLSNGFPAYSVFVLSLIVDILALFARLYEIRKSSNFPSAMYMEKVLFPCSIVFILSIIFCFIIKLIPTISLAIFLLKTIFYIGVVVVLEYLFGLSKEEKKIMRAYLNQFLKKYR